MATARVGGAAVFTGRSTRKGQVVYRYVYRGTISDLLADSHSAMKRKCEELGIEYHNPEEGEHNV